MKKTAFEFGKSSDGTLQERIWVFSDQAQEERHAISQPWNEPSMMTNGRRFFESSEIPPGSEATYEPDTDVGTGFFQRIVDRIRGK